MRPIARILLSLTCLAMIAGCAYRQVVSSVPDVPSPPAADALPAELLDAHWQVFEIEGKPVLQSSRVSMGFLDANRVAGSSSCNRYNASFVLVEGVVHVGPAAGTLMACAPESMQQERRFLDALAKVKRYELGPDGQLILGDGTRVLIRAKR